VFLLEKQQITHTHTHKKTSEKEWYQNLSAETVFGLTSYYVMMRLLEYPEIMDLSKFEIKDHIPIKRYPLVSHSLMPTTKAEKFKLNENRNFVENVLKNHSVSLSSSQEMDTRETKTKAPPTTTTTTPPKNGRAVEEVPEKPLEVIDLEEDDSSSVSVSHRLQRPRTKSGGPFSNIIPIIDHEISRTQRFVFLRFL
jgi:hypothetical protein